MNDFAHIFARASREETHLIRGNLSRLAASKQPNFVGVHPRDLTYEDPPRSPIGFGDFVWSYKADGVRGLVSILWNGKEEVWFVTDRRNDTYVLSRRNKEESMLTAATAQVGIHAVLDAEIIFKTDGLSPADASLDTLSIYCFDLLAWAQRDRVRQPFWKRHKELTAHFPPIDLARARPLHGGFQIPSKRGDVVCTCSVWTKVATHEAVDLAKACPPEKVAGCDGIVLHRRNTSYFQRDITTCYRWKPPQELTIDLLVRKNKNEATSESSPDLLAWMGKGKHAQLQLDLKTSGIPEWDSDERLAEFIIDSEKHLTFTRWRDDKYCANHLEQVKRTFRQKKDPITWTKLLEMVRPEL